MSDFKGLVEEMKTFYGVSSLEAVAEKMGYGRNIAMGWRRNKKLSANAQLKWLEAKGEMGEITENFDELTREMQAFYGVSSLEAVAEKMGYHPHNAIKWRANNKLTTHAQLKWLEAKQNQKTGEETMSKELDVEQQQLFADKKSNDMEAASAFVTANYYPDISVSAGYGRALLGEEQATTITIPVGILGNVTGLDLHKRYDVLRVYGDSMLPYIKDGEIALIERTEQASNGDVVIANIRDDLYIKYFERHPLGHWVKLRSHNKEYSDIELVGDEIELLHIVGVLRATISVKVF